MAPVGRQLLEAMGAKVVVDAERMSPWLRDQSAVDVLGTPVAVVRATTVSDVVTTLRIASATGTTVVTRGAGTGLSGGATALHAGIVLALDGMNQILEINPIRRIARVEPGVINGDLGRAAAAEGLRYTPDPGSRAISSIGGNIATNAGGMSCCKYGVTGDHVAGLTAVLADGTVIRTGGVTRKNVAGLDLTRLLVGSEGTLGVVVEATLWLRPAMLEESTVVATFASLESATAAVAAITARSTPSAVELMDRTTVTAVNAMASMGIDSDAEALLLITFDGPSAPSDALTCEEAMMRAGAADVFHTDEADEGAMLMEARRLALPALERLGSVLLDDVGVPVDQLPAMVTGVQKIAATHDLTIGTFGHAADGNLHPTIVFDATQARQREAASRAFEEIIELAISLDGTVSGEHGIGALKMPYVRSLYGQAEVDLMHRIKDAFDPRGLLNPERAY